MKNIRTTYLVIILLLSIFIFVIVLTDLNSHLEYSENDITLVDEIKINNENHLNKEKMKIILKHLKLMFLKKILRKIFFLFIMKK